MLNNMTPTCKTTKEKLMLKIQECSFVLVEVNLFLDSHPNNKQALMLRKKHLEELKALTEAYETTYGPLTAFSSTICDEWSWIDSPWPWEMDN